MKKMTPEQLAPFFEGLEIIEYFDGAEARLANMNHELAMERLLKSHSGFMEFLKVDPSDKSMWNSRCEWPWLETNVEKAKEAMAKGDIQHTALRFFWIGQLVARLSLPTWNENDDLMDKKMDSVKKKAARMRGFDAIREIRSDIELEARQIAESLWASDTEKELLIGYVADVVIGDLHLKWDEKDKETAKKIPKNATMRKWLRLIAPEYATAQRRPRKN
jgi:hypothetical protein